MSPFAFPAGLFIEPGFGLNFQWRSSAGGSTSNTTISGVTAPVWLKLTRWDSDYFAAYYSSNGTTWTQIGGTEQATVATNALAGMAASAWISGTNAASFSNVAITTVAAPSLPSGWSDGDIGSPSLPGAGGENGSTWTVASDGYNISGSSDQFNFADETMSGDGSLVAELNSQSATSYYSQSGLMIRNDTTASSAYAGLFVEPGLGLNFQWRSSASGSTSSTTISGVTSPVWLKLTRWDSDYFAAYYSSNGTTWTQIGGTEEATVATNALAGMAVTSWSSSGLNVATFTNVAITTVAAPSMPSGWSDGDIGSPSLPGAGGENGSTWTVASDGYNISGSSDQFNFADEQMSGNGSIVGELNSQSVTSYYSQSGLMIRNDTTAGSAYAGLFIEPGVGLDFQWRTSAGGSTSSTTVSGVGVPTWLELVRMSGGISAFYSANGTTWTQIGTSEGITLGSNALVGMAVTSWSSSALNVATFSNLAVTTLPTASLPSGWSDADIGSPTLAGGAGVSGSTWTVVGSGNDISGTSDQFNFASEGITGDASVVAELNSQSNTSYFAKAGLMIRNNTTAGSAYAGIFVEPGAGVNFQWRSTAAGGTSNSTIGGISTPVWLMLNRIGNSLSAYYSADGSTWHQVGQTELLSLSGTPLAGLAVSSANSALLNAATFTNVSATTGSVLPSGWTDADIGSPATPGAVGYDGNTLTLASVGALAPNSFGESDYLGATSDSFNSFYQSLGANQQIVTEVTAQQNAGLPLAKAGLVLRDSTNGNAAFAGLFVTPGWGVVMLDRAGDGTDAASLGYNNSYALANGPLWLKLTDVSGVIAGFVSTDDAHWAEIGQISVSLGSSPIAGLAASGGDDQETSTSSFANFSLGSVTSGNLVPQAPNDLMAEGYSATDGRVAWKTLSGVTSYTIQQSTDGGATFGTVATIPGWADTYLPNNLGPNTTYTYRIRSNGSSSESIWSYSVSLTTRAKALIGDYEMSGGTPLGTDGLRNPVMSVNISGAPTFASSWQQAYLLDTNGSGTIPATGQTWPVGSFAPTTSGTGYYGNSFGFYFNGDSSNFDDTAGDVGGLVQWDEIQNVAFKLLTHAGFGSADAGGDPITYADGVTEIGDTDLSSSGFTGAWSVTRNWTAQTAFTPDSTFGNGWMNQSQTYLQNVGSLSGIAPNILLATSAYDGTEFDYNSSTGAYAPAALSNDALTHNSTAHTYTWLNATTGAQSIYYDFSSSTAANLQGKLKSYADAGGNQISLTYSSGQLTTVSQTDSAGDTESFAYNYLASGVNAGKVSSVQQSLQRAGAGSPTVFRQAAYTYYAGTYTGDDTYGNLGDLKLATIKDGGGNVIDQSAYRYYTPADLAAGQQGFVGALKYAFSQESFARLSAAFTDPYTATDTQVAPYADEFYAYDSSRRVNKEVVETMGASNATGQGTYFFSYSANPSFSSGSSPNYNQWLERTTETLPDGNQNIVYTNINEDVLLTIHSVTSDPANSANVGKAWITGAQYDSFGHQTADINTSAINSSFYTLGTPSAYEVYGDVGLTEGGVLSSSGLIATTTFATTTTANTSTAGNVNGYPQASYLKQGLSGTPIEQSLCHLHRAHRFRRQHHLPPSLQHRLSEYQRHRRRNDNRCLHLVQRDQPAGVDHDQRAGDLQRPERTGQRRCLDGGA